MSSGAAIAATTEMIRLELQEFLPDLSGVLGSQPKVSALPPDRIQTGGSEVDQLNVFLYRTAPNPGWRNLDLPSRGSDGSRRSQPQLALDLHYLVSAYAAEDLHADMMLGYAMEVLHGLSVLTATAIGQRFSGATPPDVPDGLWKQLTASGIDKQAEQLTLTMEQQTTDDISKLWSVLGEKYRPSAAYVVTVVLIQPDGPAPTAFPVTQPAALLVQPLLRPMIESLDPADLVWAPGTTVTLSGSRLLGQDTTVLIGTGAVATPAATSTDQSVVLTLPATTTAGTASVRVRHTVTFPLGTPTRPFEESPGVALVVRTSPGAASHLAATATAPALIRVPLAPDVAPAQEVVLILTPASGPGFTLPASSRPAATGTIDFPASAVPAGSYVFRVRVDGVESRMTTDGTGAFDGPVVSVT